MMSVLGRRMLTDLRLSLRALAKARAFAFIAVLTLAIGIGSTTAIYSALRALVIQPFHYPAAHQLVHVWSGDWWSLSPADSIDLRAQTSSFSGVGVYRREAVNIGRENARASMAVRGASGVLHAFAVHPVLGRFLESNDETTGASPVVVLSYSLWHQLFGGDPQAINRTLRVD